MKIVILDAYTANPGDLSWSALEALGDLTIYDRTAPAEVVERATGADAILTNKVIIGKNEMEALPSLKYIGVLATGYNVVDIPEAHKRGITVTNIPAYSTMSVAQMAFAHILNIHNQVAMHSQAVKAGAWSDATDFSFQLTTQQEIATMTIGLVGLGNTGMATAKIALAFGMNVQAFTSKPQEALPAGIKKVTMDELFQTSDIVSLHCPLTESTKELVNKDRLAQMKNTAILINTGRGPLLNEQDVADALNNNVIAAAGIDVLSKEQPLPDCPLLSAKNCYITPHIAWATLQARVRLIQIASDNMKSFIEGKPVNVI
ncbi:MAG: D-2-hydroxyacid dehydrogenase [Bacteroidaceae bacterium]|nr:D-2-hydroxyacid dehydrogenase [Bacteroidaceae bacterium]